MRARFFAAVFLFCFAFSSCAAHSAARRSSLADSLAAGSGFTKGEIKTDSFILTAYFRLSKPENPVRVYIEGDGYAWVTPRRISGDPTPLRPMVLGLAVEDPSANVVYLARPCQYTPMAENPNCDGFYWTNGRFSEEVVFSVNQAVSYFVQKIEAREIDLVGYSGGGAVAVLLASRRNDVRSLRTIAGNLDIETLARYQGVSPLTGSLNPIDVADRIAKLPQRHFLGREDRVIPGFIAQSFAETSGDAEGRRITLVTGASHDGGWAGKWKELLSIPVV